MLDLIRDDENYQEFHGELGHGELGHPHLHPPTHRELRPRSSLGNPIFQPPSKLDGAGGRIEAVICMEWAFPRPSGWPRARAVCFRNIAATQTACDLPVAVVQRVAATPRLAPACPPSATAGPSLWPSLSVPPHCQSRGSSVTRRRGPDASTALVLR